MYQLPGGIDLNAELLICCHRQYETIPPLWKPIQCGASLGAHIDGAICDDEGENISGKNREYCELTAHYYAWKNINADYYGFCHYRRFFGVENCTKRPYLALGKLKEKDKTKLLGDSGYWTRTIQSSDIIAPCPEDMGLAAREHYITSRYHYTEDLQLFLDILAKHAPFIMDTAAEYLSQSKQYFCNMFIMKDELFEEYCNILFPVLAEFDEKKVMHGDFQSDRTNGYLAELYTGIFICYCRKKGKKLKELPRLDVNCSTKKRIGCMLLPPESRIRFAAKKIIKKLRGKAKDV